MHLIYNYLPLFALICVTIAKKAAETPEWAKKDIQDFSDADMERLYEQWEEEEEPLDHDELPEHLRPMPTFDIKDFEPDNPERMLAATKKGRTLMTFVKVDGNPDKAETEEITQLWQMSLWNNHIQAEKYIVDTNRAIFLFKDGSQAWVAKNYLIEQPRLETITIEGKDYHGKHAKKPENDKTEL